jgi:hypothetical protein
MGKTYSLNFRLQILKSFKTKRNKLGNRSWGSLKKVTNYVLKLYGITERTLYYWLKREKKDNLEDNNKNFKNRCKLDEIKLKELLNSEKGKKYDSERISD